MIQIKYIFCHIFQYFNEELLTTQLPSTLFNSYIEDTYAHYETVHFRLVVEQYRMQSEWLQIRLNHCKLCII